MSAPLQAEHAGDLAERDLQADPGQKADQHRARQKIREEAQADNARQYQEGRGHEGQHSCQRHVFIGAGGGKPDQAGGEYGRRGRIGADHQVPRGTEQREQGHRNEHGIETGNHRHAGNLGVTHYLRHGERSQGKTGNQFGRDPGSIYRQNALQYRQAKT